MAVAAGAILLGLTGAFSADDYVHVILQCSRVLIHTYGGPCTCGMPI